MGNHATVTEKSSNEQAVASIHDEVIGHGNSPAAWTGVSRSPSINAASRPQMPSEPTSAGVHFGCLVSQSSTASRSEMPLSFCVVLRRSMVKPEPPLAA